MLAFEWDSRKERVNQWKHGVSFAEARTVFDDTLAKIFNDRDHSDVEARELIVGHSIAGNLLVVSFTERIPNRVRIISAREVTRIEKKEYEEAG